MRSVSNSTSQLQVTTTLYTLTSPPFRLDVLKNFRRAKYCSRHWGHRLGKPTCALMLCGSFAKKSTVIELIENSGFSRFDADSGVEESRSLSRIFRLQCGRLLLTVLVAPQRPAVIFDALSERRTQDRHETEIKTSTLSSGVRLRFQLLHNLQQLTLTKGALA